MANVYTLGQGVLLTVTFRDEDGHAADPGDGHIRVRKPDGTVTSTDVADATRVSAGVYTLHVATDKVGRWFYRGEDEETGDESADENFFRVSETAFPSED